MKQPVRQADRQTGRQGRREGRQKGRQSDRSQPSMQTNRQNAPRPKDLGTSPHKHAGRREKRKEKTELL